MPDFKLVLSEKEVREIVAGYIGEQLKRTVDPEKVLYVVDRVEGGVNEIYVFI